MTAGAKPYLQAIPYQPDSCRYFEHIRHLPYPVLLDSNAAGSRDAIGRYDIVCAAPRAVIDVSASPGRSTTDLIVENPDDDGFAAIAAALEQYTSPTDYPQDIPFVSGAIGVFSYELGKSLCGLSRQSAINRPSCDRASGNWPALFAAIYQWAIVQDHRQQCAWLVADPKLERRQWLMLNELLSGVQATLPPTDSYFRGDFSLLSSWSSNLDKHDYDARFHRAKQYIAAGDCYQINLAQRLTADYQGDPWRAYKALRRQAPTPYAAYIERPSAAVASLSPERFLSVRGEKVLTQPIKGTRKRGNTAAEDTQLMADLSSSAKERAENLMIVDLMRNDIGKSCKTGSIEVPHLFRIETHPNVHHMVSTVTGLLTATGPGQSLSLLRQALPGGSITGAPKKRAMEIIDELEPDSRSVYCGSIGYITGNGDMDSNILIRSLLFDANNSAEPAGNSRGGSKGFVHCWGGGGIVADSVVDQEYEESLQKIRNLLNCLSGDS